MAYFGPYVAYNTTSDKLNNYGIKINTYKADKTTIYYT